MHLAQLNIAEALDAMESELMSDFVANIDRINGLADDSKGFVWRLTDDGGENSYHMQLFDTEFIITNMSVWESAEDLFQFVYNSGHVEIFKRRKEWFTGLGKSHMVMWYIDEGHIPSIEEAKERLEYLRIHGESPHAFTFKSRYKPSDINQ